MYSADSPAYANLFEWQVRVYYEDTDAGGVVYHASYVRFMERARTEWLRRLGYDQSTLREDGLVFAVRSLNMAFRRPARLDDLLVIQSRVEAMRRTGLTFEQTILPERRSEPYCEGRVEIACLDSETFRPCPVPEGLAMEMTRER